MPASISNFRIVPMDEYHAAAICEWHYDPPYNIYGWLPWDQMKALEVEFGNATLRQEQYVAILDEEDTLTGFAQYFPMIGVTRLGLGMHPERCGQGRGSDFVRVIAEEARRRNPQNEIDLEVLTWNGRAIRAYEAAGFELTDTYERQTPDGKKPFHCMVYRPEQQTRI